MGHQGLTSRTVQWAGALPAVRSAIRQLAADDDLSVQAKKFAELRHQGGDLSAVLKTQQALGGRGQDAIAVALGRALDEASRDPRVTVPGGTAANSRPAYTRGMRVSALGSGRRHFLQGGLALAGISLLSGCGGLPFLGRPPANVPRIGVVSGVSSEAAAPHFEALREGLREHGYEEGRDILIEWRPLDGRTERASEVIDELLRLGAAAIVTGNPVAVEAAKRATSTVPIIMAGVFVDPVEQGVIASFNRPGGNVTGLSLSVPTLGAKRLQLLKEAVPAADRIAMLWDRTLGEATIAPGVPQQEQAGRSLGMEVRSVFIERAEELESAFEAMRRDGVAALSVADGPVTLTHAKRVTDLALQHRLPSSYLSPVFVRAGGLMNYGVDQADLYRRAAGYVHKVLQGVAPADLPVEQPTKFEIVVNLKTAQALGLTIPASVLAQATEIIE